MSSSWPIGAMSFQLSIPWRVALQQSSLTLPQLRSCCNQQPSFVELISANGNRGVSLLSQRMGSLYLPRRVRAFSRHSGKLSARK